MKPFTYLCGIAVPLEGRNIDTDQIIPARFLKKNRAAGYGEYLFHDLRIDQQTQEPTNFVLNQAAYQQATILVADHNFGCGSSREGAVYTLADFGFRAVLAPSFGDIFYSNCLKNGLLPIRIASEQLDILREQLRTTPLSGQPALAVEIDLQTSTVHWQGLSEPLAFEIDPFWRECLLKGVDEVTFTMGYQEEIDAFEKTHHAQRPWLAS